MTDGARHARRCQRGFSLVESLVVAMIVSIVVASVGLSVISWLRTERQRSAAYTLYAYLTEARMEAVHRNRACRFQIDTGSRTLQVLDLNDLANNADDEEISRTTLDSAISFGRPDSATAVSLDPMGGAQFEARFDQDGALASSVGAIGIRSGNRFHRISVYAAGGIAVERWDGSTWITGG